jgi:hypothetical protein
MLSKLLSYAASRVAGDAVDGLARRAIWGGVGAVFLLFAFAMALLIGYWALEPHLGALQSAFLLAASCAAAGLIALAVPGMIDRSEKAAAEAAHPEQGTVAQTATSGKEETEAAVDYFGAIQVVASAFMLGLGAARQMRRKA